jgi:uncharacterized protein (TIGR00369 family)
MSDNLANTMPFSQVMGVNVTEATSASVVGEIEVREDLCTTGGIMHGGAIMAFADALGAIGAFLALPAGAKGTTTLESKTNFLGAAPLGERVIGKTKPVKMGARQSVRQTGIRLENGRQVALVTQTHLVL